jgi:hypothetical protein
MNYNEFSEKIKAKYPQYKDMDNRELAQKMIAKYPQYSDITFDDIEQPKQSKGLDLTPSGMTRRLAAATVAPFYGAKTGQGIIDSYKELRNIQEEQLPKNFVEKGLDVASTFALPQAKVLQAGKLAPIVNNLVTGAYQGGLIGGVQGLQEGKGLEGAAGGAGIGGALGAGLPVVGNLAKKGLELLPQTGGLFAKTLGRIQPETLKRAVQPDSVALDLTRDEAQNLLMNTTEDIQKGYKNLLDKKSENIENAINNLKANDAQVDAMGLMTDIENTFNQYGGSKINPARNMTGNLEDNLYDLIAQGTDETGNLSAIDLQKAKEQIGKMVKWDDMTAQNYYNPILEQVYGKYNSRLNNLSPQLKQANKEYSELNDFMKNEGVRRILQKGDRDTIDTASSALRNYNSTVTKGNTNRNVQDLEKILVQNGYEPFINKIDDVNAAMDLLNARTTGDSWLANLATQMTRPVLKAARGVNRRMENIPQVYKNIGAEIPEAIRRLMTLGAVNAIPLQGRIEINDTSTF